MVRNLVSFVCWFIKHCYKGRTRKERFSSNTNQHEGTTPAGPILIRMALLWRAFTLTVMCFATLLGGDVSATSRREVSLHCASYQKLFALASGEMRHKCRKIENFILTCLRPVLEQRPEYRSKLENVAKKLLSKKAKVACGMDVMELLSPYPTTGSHKYHVTTPGLPMEEITLADDECGDQILRQCFPSLETTATATWGKSHELAELASFENLVRLCRLDTSMTNTTWCVQDKLKYCPDSADGDQTMKLTEQLILFCQENKACDKINQLRGKARKCSKPVTSTDQVTPGQLSKYTTRGRQCPLLSSVVECIGESLQPCAGLRQAYRRVVNHTSNLIKTQCPVFAMRQEIKPQHSGNSPAQLCVKLLVPSLLFRYWNYII